MGRLSLTGTRTRTGTLDEAQHLVWPVHAAGWDVHWGSSFSDSLQRGHVEVHSIFILLTRDDYLLPAFTPDTRAPNRAGFIPKWKS